MAGASFHIRCPACGQPFLTPMDHPQMAQACPFCHFNGLRGQFPSVQDAPQPQARHEPRRFAPTTASGKAPIAWEVQQLAAPTPAPYTPPFQPPTPAPPRQAPMPAPAPGHTPGPADWAAIQAYQEMMARQGAPPPAAGELAPPPAPRHQADWVPMKPSNLPKLNPWPGLDSGTDIPLAPWDPAAQKPRIPWVVLLVILVVGGLVAALAIERRRADAATAKAALEASAEPTPQQAAIGTPIEGGTVAKAIPVDNKPLPKECKLTPAESEEVAKQLLERLFAATNTAERLACIDAPIKNTESVEDFFSRHPQVSIKSLSVVNKLVRCLPTPAPQAIFDLTTSLSTDASGIVRLTTDTDGELKLDWLLLRDSLDGTFATFQKKPPGADSQWVTLGLRRNYGFGETSELREANLFFDMQGYGNGLDKTLVQTLKNTSTGRAMDQGIGWGELFIVRVLIGWQTFNGKPRLTVINILLDDTGLGS